LFHGSNRHFAKGRSLSYRKFGLILVVSTALAGCTSAGSRFWVAQAPGDIPEPQAPRTAQAQPAPRPAATSPAAPATSAGIAAPSPAAAMGGYTQASRYGDLLFVSGQIGLDPVSSQMRGTTIADQTRQVMENVRSILEAHRLTLANVVSVTVYMRDLNEFRAMDDVYETYFRGNLPSRSVVQVTRLPRDALVEISVIAGR
jgi:2-iminobutanoate/2-iminopropanoate deaminase